MGKPLVVKLPARPYRAPVPDYRGAARHTDYPHIAGKAVQAVDGHAHHRLYVFFVCLNARIFTPAKPEKPLTNPTTNPEIRLTRTIPGSQERAGAPPVKMPATRPARSTSAARCRYVP